MCYECTGAFVHRGVGERNSFKMKAQNPRNEKKKIIKLSCAWYSEKKGSAERQSNRLRLGFSPPSEAKFTNEK
jgi:hypothetical protein